MHLERYPTASKLPGPGTCGCLTSHWVQSGHHGVLCHFIPGLNPPSAQHSPLGLKLLFSAATGSAVQDSQKVPENRDMPNHAYAYLEEFFNFVKVNKI